MVWNGLQLSQVLRTPERQRVLPNNSVDGIFCSSGCSSSNSFSMMGRQSMNPANGKHCPDICNNQSKHDIWKGVLPCPLQHLATFHRRYG